MEMGFGYERDKKMFGWILDLISAFFQSRLDTRWTYWEWVNDRRVRRWSKKMGKKK